MEFCDYNGIRRPASRSEKFVRQFAESNSETLLHCAVAGIFRTGQPKKLKKGLAISGQPIQQTLAGNRAAGISGKSLSGLPIDHSLHGFGVAVALDLHAGRCAVELGQVLGGEVEIG